MARRLWRVFPWSPEAQPGEPFSAEHVPPSSGQGRFDLRYGESRVLYLAESPTHAVAEAIQGFRGVGLESRDLRRGAGSLALCQVREEAGGAERADLCDPGVLARHDIAPDHLASRKRHLTQSISQSLWDLGYSGLRWWSAFGGDWHGTVIFMGRGGSGLRFQEPEPLEIDHPAVKEAAQQLGIPLRNG